MRKFNPVYLAAAVAIALSGPTALAQTTGGAVRTAPSGVTTTTNTSPNTSPAARPAASTGGCTGTNGSSCTATTNNSPSTNGTATNSSTPGVFDASTSGTPQSTQATGVGSSAGGVSGSAMGTNQTTVDPATARPGSFAPGGTFGPPDTNAPGTMTVPSTLTGTGGAVLIPGDTGNPSQQNIVIQNQPAPQPERALATPLLDQTTREAQSRETRRRNAKQEPRIIGIAPNTDRDLTHQMPDDRIIRY